MKGTTLKKAKKNLSKDYDFPICFIQGDSDYITPTALVQDYYSQLEIEKKELIVIDNAGHTPFLDSPEKFCEAVKNFLSENVNE